MPEVIMPKMGDAMEEGTLLKWLKQEGDAVEEGDPIAEIETDKVSLELEAEASGKLAEIVAREGESVPVGDPIAVILAEGEEPPKRRSREKEPVAASSGESGGSVPQAAAAIEEPAPPKEAPGADSDGAVRASPIVRRLAREHDLDLSGLQGSGPQGRIVERDVRSLLERGAEAAPAPHAVPSLAAPEAAGAPGTRIKEMNRMQRVIAERMVQSKQQIPHFYATVEIEMDAAMALRKQLNEALGDELKLSINDFAMKACAMALKGFPSLNSLYTRQGVELHEKVDMAMAVALESGLITPVIRDAANKPLSAISREAKDLARRARDGHLKPDEYQGGTFTVSNMGMFGIESFSAIINPPQAAIVGVGSIVRRPVYKDDEIVPANLMKLTLSADHRVANGAEGALYLREVKRLLENPMLMLI